ncbi:MAG: DUF3857 and transglutaminase domain-containing protein, partial [Victivallaceae bacterium]|nr:DUF3857 and transglutaminase domain-containing protein [Victivallaceae bacterium]
MKLKKLICVVFIFAIAVSTAFSAQNYNKGLVSTAELIKNGKEVTTNSYPDSDSVIIADFERIKYKPDGSYVSLMDQCCKILTEKGKREERTLSLWYDVAYGTVIVSKVEIIKPDGKIIPVDIKKNSKDMVEASQMEMNIYNPNSRVVKVNFPDIKIGDMIRLVAVKKEIKPRVPNTWYDIKAMEAPSPIIHEVVEIIAPKARPLKHMVLKNEISNTVTHSISSDKSSITYKWEVRNVPRMFPEPGMPGYTAIQHLLVSTIPKWQQVSKWYYKLCEPRLKDVTPEMSNMVAELTVNASTDDEKIKALFKYVSQKIRYMGITTEDTAPGYEPHDVSITFNNKYGVCRDKAALL